MTSYMYVCSDYNGMRIPITLATDIIYKKRDLKIFFGGMHKTMYTKMTTNTAEIIIRLLTCN